MEKRIQIRNLRKGEHILGSITVFKDDGKGNKVHDYVCAPQSIAPGCDSAPMTRDEFEYFNTPVLEAMVNAGELDLVIDGVPKFHPKTAKASAIRAALSPTIPAEEAEAASLASILDAKPE